MQIVLRSDFDKIGKRGDTVEVADGYARNFLIPRGHAIAATKGIAAQATAMRASRDRADAKNRSEAQQIATKIVGATLVIPARVGSEGKLFGSVTNADLVDALKEQVGVDIERRQIELHEPIRTVGEHDVPVKLHADVHVAIKVDVTASE